mgnify:CR=1 FL=1
MKINRSIISVIIPVLTMLGLYLIEPPLFLTNDDSGIQNTLAGCYSEAPYPYHQFINVVIGYFECFLFKIAPKLPWWFLTEVSLCVFGASFFNYTVLRIINPFKHCNNNRKIFAFILIAIFNFLYFSSNILMPSFTVSPAIFSAGAISLLFIPKKNEHTFLIPLFCGLAILCSSLIRRDSGYVCLCFYGVGLFYWFFKGQNSKYCFFDKKKLFFFICFLVFIGTAIFSMGKISSKIQESHNSKEFTNFNSARAIYMGYPHMRYDDNPDFFRRLGCNREKYDLLGAWCFLDKSVTTEFFLNVLNAQPSMSDKSNDSEVSDSMSNKDLKHKTRRFVLSVKNLLKEVFFLYPQLTNDYIKNLFLSSILVSLIPFLIFFEHRKIVDIDFLAAIMAVCGMWIMFAYLKIKGRLPVRALLVIMIPMYCITSVLAIKNHASQKCSRIYNIFVYICIIVCLCSLNVMYLTINMCQQGNYRMEKQNKIISYVEQHPNDVYIHDLSINNVMPFKRMPVNLFFWGGSTWKSDLYKRHLEQLGIEYEDMNMFRGENVHFLTSNKDMLRRLALVLCKEYGCKEIKTKFVDDEEKFMVCDFIFNKGSEPCTGKYLILPELLCTFPGTRFTMRGEPVSQGNEILAYGPYMTAFAGKYRVKCLYDFENLNISDHSEICRFCVTADCGKKELTSFILTSTSEENCTFEVDIPKPMENVEIVCYTSVPGFVLKGYEVRYVKEH